MVPRRKARLFNAEMIDIPTFFLYSLIPYPLTYLTPEKCTSFGKCLPVYVIIGSASPFPLRAGKHPFATWDVR